MRLFSIHFNFVKGILTRVFKSLCFVTKCLVLVAFLGYIFCFFLHWHVILLYGTILFNINIIFGLFLRSLFITEWASEFSAEMTASFFRCCLWLVDMIFKHCYYYPIYILISLYFRGFTTAVPHWAYPTSHVHNLRTEEPTWSSWPPLWPYHQISSYNIFHSRFRFTTQNLVQMQLFRVHFLCYIYFTMI